MCKRRRRARFTASYAARKVREENFDPFLSYIPAQAAALYADWPVGEYAAV